MPASPSDPSPSPTPNHSSVDPSRKYWWSVAIVVPVTVALIGVLPSLIGGGGGSAPSGATTISNTRIGDDLYFITTVDLADPALQARLDQALMLARTNDYGQARALLEQAAREHPSPAIYNNLGVVSAALGDDAAARQQWQQALQLEPGNEAARRNLDRVEAYVTQHTANNTILTATPIRPGDRVTSHLVSPDDTDFWAVTLPPGPRDLVTVRIDHDDLSFRPNLGIFDGERNEIAREWRSTPGAVLSHAFAADGEATYYLQVSDYLNRHAGAYAISATPDRAFDTWEPNDRMSQAREIRLGQRVDAGILDRHDHDFYQVQARAGTLRLSFINRSETLAPEVAVFDQLRNRITSEYRTTGGASMDLTVEVREAGTWYVQVSAWSNSSGEYTLLLEQ